MDSLTHIVLGAATGEVILGKKVGNKALIWGAIAGSLPDFDTIFTPLLSPIDGLFFHRGASHAFIFALIAAPILGYIASRFHKDKLFMQWTFMSLLAIMTHSTIDILNTYGTALLLPFSNQRLAFDAIGIVDFAFLIPITTLLTILIIKPQASPKRKKYAIWILAYSAFFVVFAISNKLYIEQNVKKQLQSKGIEFSRLNTAPLPYTNFLWLVMAEDPSGFHYGYISNFDKQPLKTNYIKRNNQLLQGNLNGSSEIEKIKSFTKGFYTVEQQGKNTFLIYDLRFGSLDFDNPDNWYVFTFNINKYDEKLDIATTGPDRKLNWENSLKYFKRVFRDL